MEEDNLPENWLSEISEELWYLNFLFFVSVWFPTLMGDRSRFGREVSILFSVVYVYEACEWAEEGCEAVREGGRDVRTDGSRLFQIENLYC